MIDLHSHILPGIDDGARNLETALEMARMAVSDGIDVMACTPHIYPGRWENTAAEIKLAAESFKLELAREKIPLVLITGADIQVVPDMSRKLNCGELPTLNGSRYFLFEPPHHVSLPRLDDIVGECLKAGFIPVITHPERLFYINDDYSLFSECARMGAWIQITAGSLMGRFGKKPRLISERFLKDGLVHLIASDAHNTTNRRPELAKACKLASRFIGKEEADRMVSGRPELILEDAEPDKLPLPPSLDRSGNSGDKKGQGWLARLF